MSRNGSGTYSAPSGSFNPATNGNSATAADWNTLLADLVAAMTQSVSADGQTPITGNFNMGNNKLTSLGVGNASGQSLAWQQLFSQGTESDLPSAATTDIGAQNTNFLRITGTTAITSFGTNFNGPRFLRFAGALTLTHNATTLILPGGLNITTAAGDCAVAIPISGGWYVIYQRVSGLALVQPTEPATELFKNLWRNSDNFINQRSTATSVADGAYGLIDRTYFLQESGNVTVSRLNQPTDGIPYAMRLTQPDVGAKRIGFAQAVESADCLAYRGSQLVFAPKLRLSTSANLRVALLAWTGTADTITRDVVNNWASGTYTPGNFFLASNVSVIAVGSAAMTANTWADVPVSSASAGGVVAPSTMNNLIMMVWSEATVAQNVTLDASCIRAGLGTQTPIWTPPDVEQELRAAMRWYEDMPNTDVFLTMDLSGTSAYTFAFPFSGVKRIAPLSGNVTLTGNMTGFGAPSFSTASAKAIRIAATSSGAAAARIFSSRVVTDVSL